LPSTSEIGNCGLPPIAVAQGLVNVRSGPGIEFPNISELEYQQERVIVGRAGNAAWWQILLTVDQLGWVSDQAVTVVGYTAAVPITSEDQLDGVQPLWNPTPNPACTPPSQEEIAISNGRLASALAAASQGMSADPPPTPEPDSGPGTGLASPGFSVLQPDQGTLGARMIWLPIVGGFLIVAGGIALLVQRRRY
jgi:hypothetical protein